MSSFPSAPYLRALEHLPVLSPAVTQLFASFLHGAGLPDAQILEMAREFAHALQQLGDGHSPTAIAAGPARYAEPFGDEALFAQLDADARHGAPPTQR